MNDKREKMKQVRDDVFALEASPLYAVRVAHKTFPVIGEGDHDARIMFIGEAPGKNEAATGRPFVGASGKILNELLESVSIAREKVYITNIVKDRPPQNRDPLPEEIDIYAPFLDRQIDIIQPAVIATLGRFAMIYSMKKFGLEAQLEPISKLHGREFTVQASYGPITLLPLYHPAVAVYNSTTKDMLKEDFKILKKYL